MSVLGKLGNAAKKTVRVVTKATAITTAGVAVPVGLVLSAAPKGTKVGDLGRSVVKTSVDDVVWNVKNGAKAGAAIAAAGKAGPMGGKGVPANAGLPGVTAPAAEATMRETGEAAPSVVAATTDTAKPAAPAAQPVTFFGWLRQLVGGRV